MSIGPDELVKKLVPEDAVYYFTSGVDPKTGEMWCSDCVDAKAALANVIIPALEKIGGKFITVNVGQRDEWKNPNHQLRKHAIFNVPKVPTLMFIRDAQKVAQLVEEQIWDTKMSEAFLSEVEN